MVICAECWLSDRALELFSSCRALDRDMSVNVTTGEVVKRVDGFTISIIPSGESSVRVLAGGRFTRLFTIRSEDLAKKCSNAESYATPHPNVAPFEPWRPV